jgi:Response regulators consisting of a CheY-like receiver domain and a winged-helix DNA-binding domain
MDYGTVNILIIEGDPEDADLIANAFEGVEIQNRTHIIGDGEAALDFLYRKGDYKEVPFPDLIIMDLNIPKKQGIEILKAVKCDKTLKIIPVIILTASNALEDIVNSYRNYANCYITKPTSFAQFTEIAVFIELFWLNVVSIPGCYIT